MEIISPTLVTPSRTERTESSLAEAYGYYGRSENTTMALVRKVFDHELMTIQRMAL